MNKTLKVFKKLIFQEERQIINKKRVEDSGKKHIESQKKKRNKMRDFYNVF